MRILEKASTSGKKARVTRRVSDEVQRLSITSLLDILTIVLVFLIKNVSMDAHKLTVPDKMNFPTTMTVEQLEQNMGTTVIKVYPEQIFVGVDNIRFGTPQELLQDPKKRADLHEYLSHLSSEIEGPEESKEEEKRKEEEKGEACLLVQADERIPAQYITAIVEIGTGSYYKYVYFSTLKDSNWLENEAPKL